MAAEDPVVLTKMLIVTDYDVGFQLMPTLEPLPEVAPGDTYVTECKPQQAIKIQEVVTEPFAIVQIAVGREAFQTTIEQIGPRRIYRLDPPLIATPDDWIRVQLTNDTGVSHKQKIAVIVKLKSERQRIAHSPTSEAIAREHDIRVAVENRCGFCGDVFEMSPLDPHATLINQAIKNSGRGGSLPHRCDLCRRRRIASELLDESRVRAHP